jgi:hypothetical protein
VVNRLARNADMTTAEPAHLNDIAHAALARAGAEEAALLKAARERAYAQARRLLRGISREDEWGNVACADPWFEQCARAANRGAFELEVRLGHYAAEHLGDAEVEALEKELGGELWGLARGAWVSLRLECGDLVVSADWSDAVTHDLELARARIRALRSSSPVD